MKPALFFLGLTSLVFWQFFLKGLSPFPGNYLLVWYEPWRSEFSKEGIPTLPHKAIADDTFRQHYPFKVLATDLLKRRELPLWNPYNGGGQPLLATMHPGFLNPLNVLYLLLPSYLSWTFFIILQLFFAGLFMFLFARKIGMQTQAGLFASITFMLSGAVITRLIFGEYVYILSLLPVLFYLIESYKQNPKTKKVFLVPIATAILFFSGQPQAILYVLLLTFFYSLYRLRSVLLLARLFFFFFLGIGLAMVQLLPTFELFLHSNVNRNSSLFIFDRFLLPIQHLITILIPNYFGNQATYNYWGAGDYIETAASVGIIPCFFAVLTLVIKSAKFKQPKFFFAIATLVTIALSLDWFGSRLFFSLPIPILATGAPSRIFLLTTFALSVLAGIGFEHWTGLRRISKTFFYQLALISLLVLLIVLGTFLFYAFDVSCNNLLIANCRIIALRNTLLEVAAFFLILPFLIAFVFTQKKLFVFGVVGVVMFLGLYNAYKFLPFSSKETFLPENRLVKTLQKKTKDARVFGMGEANIKTNLATHFRIFDPNYYDPLYNKRYGEFIAFANTGNLPEILPRSDIEIANDAAMSAENAKRRNRLLQLLGVKYIVEKNTTLDLKENSEALPRAFMVGHYEVITNKEAILHRLFDPTFDPASTVIVERDVGQPQEVVKGTAAIVDYRENSVIVETKSDTNQILVLSDNYYPGWEAYVDNRHVPLLRANYTFRAIAIPAGLHRVEFFYQPESFRLGLIISCAFFLLYLLIFFVWKKERGNKNRR